MVLRIFSNQLRNNYFKNIHSSNCMLKLQFSSGAYEPDGRTTVSIFNTNPENGLMITSYSQYGFRLNNNMSIMGPMAIFPRSVLSWNVNSHEDVNADSLSLFFAIQPKIDLLILGLGNNVPAQVFNKTLINEIRKHKINIEILRTEQACATFNFLSAEQRMVAAALIPPLHITYNENDIVQNTLKKKELFTMSE